MRRFAAPFSLEGIDVACENCHLPYWYPPHKAPASLPSQKNSPN